MKLHILLIALLFAAPLNAQNVTTTVPIGAGDVLKLKVFGQQELSDLYEVGPDGNLVIPGLGRVTGVTTLQAAESSVRALIDQNFGVEGTSFALTIAEFRPITVSGDVAKPGEIAYKLGTRVAQVLARAGGQKRSTDDDFNKVIQLNQERERLAIAEMTLARSLMSRARLRAELDNKLVELVPEEVISLIGEPLAQDLLKSEQSIARANLAMNQITQSRVSAATDINSADITARSASELSLQKQLDLIRADLERLSPLIERGAITGDRILALRRDIAQVEGLVSQATASLSTSQTEQNILADEKDVQEFQRRIGILAQLVSVEADIMNTEATIAAVQETLDVTGTSPLSLRRGQRPGECRMVILREQADGAPQVIEADVLTVVQPGDHLQVGPVVRGCPDPFFSEGTSQ